MLLPVIVKNLNGEKRIAAKVKTIKSKIGETLFID
jgi:hypothetical protein